MTTAPQSHLGYLDGLRGGAALWVVLAHCGIWGGWSFLPDPKTAVDIFMIMSGYLMTYHYAEKEGREDVNTWRMAGNFWIRRFFRIAPLYYLLLAVVFVLAPWIEQTNIFIQSQNPDFWSKLPVYDPHRLQCTASDFWMHVTFLFGLFPKYAMSVPLPDWSIGLEMQFYAVFPLLFLLMRKCGYVVFVVGALGAGWGIKHGLGLSFPEPSFLPLKLSLFIIGMIAAEAHFNFAGGKPIFMRAPLIVMALLLASRHSLYVVAVTLLVIFLGLFSPLGNTVRLPAKILNTILSNRLTRFMADASYSVYLVHGLFITLFGGDLFNVQLAPPARVALLTVMVTALSYSTAVALHHGIEQPGLKLGRKLIKIFKL